MADKQKGWIKVYRCIEDNWLWDEVPFSYGQAWIDMLMMANHTQKKTLFNKEPVTIERGSFITSIRKLSTRWGWSKDKVLRFIRTLETDAMITKNSDNQRTLVTIVKYGDYQKQRDTDKDADKDTDAPRNRHEADTNKDTDAPQTRSKELKNDKNEKKEKKGSIAPRPEHKEIIDYFNEKAGTKYMHTSKSTQTAINARLNDRFSVNDFKAVIDIKVKKWLNDPKMRDYLRPETLFAASHFESYLNEAIAEKPQAQRSSLSERLMNETTAEETDANINNHSSDNYPFK